MNSFFKLIICLIIPLAVGGISGVATASGMDAWFLNLNKPIFNPPNYLFGPVWTLLYILMGISLYLIIQTPKVHARKKAIIIFALQLFLNFCWSFLFFKFHLLGIAFIEILLIWVSIITMIFYFKKLNKTAAYLQIPYLLWVSFASVLNGSIWFLN